MLQLVDVGRRSPHAYRGTAPDAQLEALAGCAGDLQGARVLHINATPYGGGVSELLRSTIPLLNGLGLVADWRIISGDRRFFEVTKALHNGLQGQPVRLSEAERNTYLETMHANAATFQERYDFVFVHDPQPLPLLDLAGDGDARWIWRCHIDTSEPDAEAWELVRGHLPSYDAAVFTLAEFCPPDVPVPRVEVFPPAIDPLSPKNLELDEETAARLLDWIGVDPAGPLISQISRFDPWKDPLGVLAAYRLAREEVDALRLALVGSMALDDPEGWDVYRQVAEAADGDPRIHLHTNLTGVGNVEVNAFQRLSDVIVQKSTREGFGLVVSEALWKQTPVVAGRAGGIPLQMADGAGGHLVDDVEGCARAIVTLLRDREAAQDLAQRGQQRVREHFLLPRLVLNELALMRDLAQGGRTGPSGPAVDVDPVCGMVVDGRDPRLIVGFDGRDVRFCSHACRLRFLEEPARYMRGTR